MVLGDGIAINAPISSILYQPSTVILFVLIKLLVGLKCKISLTSG